MTDQQNVIGTLAFDPVQQLIQSLSCVEKRFSAAEAFAVETPFPEVQHMIERASVLRVVLRLAFQVADIDFSQQIGENRLYVELRARNFCCLSGPNERARINGRDTRPLQPPCQVLSLPHSVWGQRGVYAVGSENALCVGRAFAMSCQEKCEIGQVSAPFGAMPSLFGIDASDPRGAGPAKHAAGPDGLYHGLMALVPATAFLCASRAGSSIVNVGRPGLVIVAATEKVEIGGRI